MRRMVSGVAAGCVGASLWLVPAPVQASSTGTPKSATQAVDRVHIAGPARAHYRTDAVITGRLVDEAGEPVSGVTATLQLRRDGAWERLAGRVSDDAGSVRVSRWMGRAFAGRNLRVRWSVADGERTRFSAAHVVDLRRQSARLRLRGPHRVVDERRARLRVQGVTELRADVPGRVTLWQRGTGRHRRWHRMRAKRLRSGEAGFRVRPRVDTVYRVTAPRRWWYRRPAHDRHRVDNVPPGRVVRKPRRAPRVRVRLPAQRRAVGRGPNPRVTRIGNRVWSEMTGRSWHRGCPVGRSRLRIVRLNYWGFDGYRHRGEIVVNADVVWPTVRVFRELHRIGHPIRSMYRVDRFGWSRRLKGANDYRSMAADNTSAFNCRSVVGSPGRRSPHSYGRSIDLNPWENPYVSRRGVYPNRWWLPRDRPGVVVHRSYSHPVVRAFRRNGFSWGGAYSDFHHFQD